MNLSLGVFGTVTPRIPGVPPNVSPGILSIEANDTAAQTRRVLQKVAELEGGLVEASKVDPKWIDYQRWLAAGERRVVVPFARELSEHENLYDQSVRWRDFSQVLTTAKACALLHREHRKETIKVASSLDTMTIKSPTAYSLTAWRRARV